MTSAYALSRQGWAVTVLDRFFKPGQGASLGNGRQLSYSHTNALAGPSLLAQIPSLLFGDGGGFQMTLRGKRGYFEWLARFLVECSRQANRRNTLAVLSLAEESRRAMDDLLARHSIEFNRKNSGKLVILRSTGDVEAARPLVEAKRKAGLEQEVLSAEQACEIEPALAQASDRFAGALYAPGDETGDCSSFCRGLLSLLQSTYGVKFRGSASVDRFARIEGKVETHLANGEILTSDLVVAANGHAVNDLLAPLSHHLPVQPMKGYSFTAPLGNAAPMASVTDHKRRIVFTHCGDRLLVAGIAEMGHVDTSVDLKRLKSMIASARDSLPEAAVYSEADAGWAGLRPMTPNSQPIIRMLEPGIAVNAGHGMLGWTLAMGSAERLSELVREHN